MNKTILGITFIGWEYWPYGIICIALFIMRYLLAKKRALVAHNLASPNQAYNVLEFSLVRHYAKIILYAMALLFIYCTLLRPAWGKKEEIFVQEGRSVLIIFDISRSMLVQDKKPNRLEFAKEKVRKLVANLSCERCGLIIFSGSTVVQCPLTTDFDSFFMFLDQLDAETISSGTTALDQALRKALTIYNSTSTDKSKLAILFTDGEDFSSNLREVKQEARAMNMNIFAVGIGTQQGGPVPIVDHDGHLMGHQKDAQGNIVISRLNEGILQSLVHDVGGMYMQAIDNDDDIKKIVAEVQRIEKEQFDDKKVDTLQERYQYCAVIACILLIVEWLL